MLRRLRLLAWAGFFAIGAFAQGLAASQDAARPATPVDALIPWLLQEDAQLRGLPFAEVIFDATGKKVIAVDPQNETDRRVIKQISATLDSVVRRLNGPASAIQGIAR